MLRTSNDRRLIPWQKANTETWQGGTNFRQFREFLKGTIHKSTHTDFVFASELLFRHIFACCMEVIYGSVFLRGERVRPLLSEQHKQPCLPRASSHDIIAAQECSQAESSERKSSFHLSLSLPLSHSIPISFWKDTSIIYPPFPLLGKNSPFSFFVCVSYVHCNFSLNFFLTSATTLLKQASLILLLIQTVTDFNKTLIPKGLYFVAQLVPPSLNVAGMNDTLFSNRSELFCSCVIISF